MRASPEPSALRRRRGGSPSNGGDGRSSGPPNQASGQRPLELPKEHSHRSRPVQLWLRSRLLSSHPPAYRSHGEDRPLTIANVWLALELVGLLWRRFLGLFWGEHRVKMGVYLAGRAVKGVLPTARLWASSQMLDLVQRSFEAGVIPTCEVFRVAALSMLLTASDDIFRFLSQNNDTFVRNHINYVMEKAYLRAQLSLSIPALSSPFISAIMYEAGVFAGFETRTTRWGPQQSNGPFEALSSTFQLLTLFVQVGSQVILLLRTITTDSKEVNSSAILLVILSLAPSLLRIGGSWAGLTMSRATRRMNWSKTRKDEKAIKDLGRNGGYKQEVVLFGLRDWVLGKWEDLKMEQIRMQQEQKASMGTVELGLGLSQEAVQTAFYVLLALRTLSTNLSLGSIRLYQNTASSLLRSLRSYIDILSEVFQEVFYLAAFIEAIDLPDHPELLVPADRRSIELISYESTRTPGGMAIQAIDLEFTYPGSDKPTLRNINLVIAPGETLAIVGFNGGGKTTLVKALMGLYDHSGTLLINGRPSEEYDPDTLHARTSCLFQDFSKYSLTLRENVGIGNVPYIQDTGAIERAIERGGAEGVRDKVGLDGQLNRFGVPDNLDDGEGGGGGGEGGRQEEEEVRPMPSPGKMGRGGGPPGAGRGKRGLFEFGGSERGAGFPRGPPPGEFPSGLPPGPPPPGVDGDRPPGPPPELRMMLEKEKANREADTRASLSGGQWQRVALSRAFLRADDADLVVFDEPSASLDPRAESQLFQRIHALSRQDGRRTTTIYISHRFSTVRRADQIAVVEDGTIAELGSHAKLMALKGRYFELFNLQKEGFEDD